MNCANHPEVPAVGYCRECGKALCDACHRDANGTLYCQEHSPVAAPPAGPPPPSQPTASPYTGPDPMGCAVLQPPQNRPPEDPGASPGLAFLLGFIPGVGAIYNGQYVKGLIHVVIMGLLIAIVSDGDLSGNLEPLFGMMIAVWVFYMAFEAYHTAKRRQLGQPVDEFSSILPRHGQHSRFPLAPTVLIAAGLIFLLHNLDILRIGQILRYWPVALIGLGVYMLYERVSGSPARNGHGTNAPGGRP
jgi:hypothetical protein